jgi:PelA/Pel-15E family pectate lyase
MIETPALIRASEPAMKQPFLLAVAVVFTGVASHAAIIGTNVPAAPLTAERVAAAPAWRAYLENSQRQRQADQAFLRAELQSHGLQKTSSPPGTHSAKGMTLDASANWYAGAEANRIAENLISFQTPAGGWSKNTDYAKSPRAPGEMFGAENGSLHLGTNDFDSPTQESWSYVGTFDNGATTTELRFLAKVISASKSDRDDLLKSFLRGLDYIFAAQYPNGGWPQVWPLQGGYHDDITLNDDAMLHILTLLHDVAGGAGEFTFISADQREKAAASYRRGMDCLLAAQVMANGRRSAWCQQYDALTLRPSSARNYEMPALTSAESATIVLFLMQLPNPNSNEVAAVHAACAWFEKAKIEGKAFKSVAGQGRELMDAPTGGPLWSRYYEVGTDRPIFGDRDKTIHDDVNEISRERRQGYGWFRDTPKRVLEHYKKWAKLHP